MNDIHTKMHKQPNSELPDDDTYCVVEAHRWSHGKVKQQQDYIAEEVPVALIYNQISHAVLLTTPHDLHDFAIGFSLSEGIVHSINDIHDINILSSEHGVSIKLTIKASCFKQLKDKRRSMAARSSCGICGIENLDQFKRQARTISSQAVFSIDKVQRGFDYLKHNQPIKELTGATHAAAWLNTDGNVPYIREDIGRHNALDKLLGCLIREKKDLSQGAILITSRASYEMVMKSTALGVAILAAISAPTGLAIRLAESSNLTLAGYVRDKQLMVYSHGSRLVSNVQSVSSK